MTRQSTVRQKYSNNTIEFGLCWLLLGMRPALKCGLHTLWNSIEENHFFPFESRNQLEIASGLGTEFCVYFPSEQ